MRSDGKVECFRGGTYFVYRMSYIGRVGFNHKRLLVSSAYELFSEQVVG